MTAFRLQNRYPATNVNSYEVKQAPKDESDKESTSQVFQRSVRCIFTEGKYSAPGWADPVSFWRKP